MSWKRVLLLSIVLSWGCVSGVTTERWVFERPGTPEAQVKRDRSECFARSISATNADRGRLISVDREAYRQCMEERGYVARVSLER